MSVTVSTTYSAITVMKQETSFDQINLQAKKELCCSSNGTSVYLALTDDCDFRDMTARNFDRGFTLVGRVGNQHIQSYLDEFGIAKSATWWSMAKPEWQYQEEKSSEHTLRLSRRSSSKSRVYFIYNPERNMIKIGWTRSIDSRLSTLQTASPDKLELLGHIEGDRGMEAQFHERFSEYHSSGEWFIYADEVREVIEELLN